MIALFLFLGGCAELPFRIGLFSVSGNLVNYSTQRCSLSAKDDGPGFRRITSPRTRPIIAIFEESFRITPSRKTYRIEVICNSRVIHRRTVIYPGTLGYGGVVELGVLI